MSLNIFSRRIPRASVQHWFANHAATAPQEKHAAGAPVKEEPKLSVLPSGLTIASFENLSPITRIAVIIKAGARYETYENLGITHTLRYCAGLGSKETSMFHITRNIQLIGAGLRAWSSRDHFAYTLDCNRDDIDTGLEYLGKVVAEQSFRPWEVSDHLPRQKIDIAFMRSRAELVLMELLHKTAYRTGLQNNLYCPKHMIGHHTQHMLKAFVKNHFTNKRMALVGVGIPHNVLKDYAELFDLEGGDGPAEIASQYKGGEIRLDRGGPYTYVAVAAEGVSLKTPKDVLAASVLQQALGIGPHVKRGVATSKLMQAAMKATKNPFAVSSINLNYTDSGLFGFYVVGQPEDMDTLVKALVSEFNATAKNGVADKDFQAAKNRVKAFLLMSLESKGRMVEDMSIQALIQGKILTVDEMEKLIDSVSLGDVNNVAKKVAGSKPTMTTIGNLKNAPFLDQLK